MAKQLTYLELKTWLGSVELPSTLNGEHQYYKNVTFFVNAQIKTIDGEFEKLGKLDIKTSSEAKRAKRKLAQLYKDLKNSKNWNKPLQTLIEYIENNGNL